MEYNDEIDRTGLCTVRQCVEYMNESGNNQCELSYVEDGIRYNVTIKIDSCVPEID